MKLNVCKITAFTLSLILTFTITPAHARPSLSSIDAKLDQLLAQSQVGSNVNVLNPLLFTQQPREPVIIEASLTAGVNSGGGIMGNYTVPADRRLVIEHVSFETNFVVCTFTSSVRVRISGTTGAANFYLNPLPPMALPGSSTRFTRGSQAMKLYAPPGANVQINWTRTARTCEATGSVAIMGYLEEDIL